MGRERKRLRQKFQSAHIKDDQLKDVIAISDDLDITDTLNLMLDSEIVTAQNQNFYRLDKDLKGQFYLGTEPRGKKTVKIDQNPLSPGLLYGKTQYGKSNQLLNFASQFLEQNVPFWAFEPKQDQRHLVKKFPDLKVLRLDEIKQNPFNPPTEVFQMRRWLQIVWELLTQEQELLSGSRAMGYELLETILEEALTEKGSDKKKIPTLFDLLALVEKLLVTTETRAGPRRQYLERLKTRTKSELFSFNYTLDCQKGWPIEELQKNSIIFEYEGIDTSAVRFMILVLLYKLFFYRRKNDSRLASDFHFLVFDEGEKIFSPYLEGTATGNPFLNEIINWSKEFGIGFIVANQTPKVLSSLKDNASTRMIFNLDGGYLTEMAPKLNLDSTQQEALLNLDVGSAVISSPKLFPKPFLIDIPLFEIEKDVSDQEIKEKMKDFKETMDEKVVPLSKKTSPNGKEEHDKAAEKIDMNSHVLIENIARFPYLSITQRREEKLGWSNSRLSKTRKKLRNKGYLRKVRVIRPDGGRGSSLTLLELTGKALKYLKKKGIKTKYIGRGGAAHSYYLKYFLDNLEKKNVDVSYETDVGGIYVDIFLVKQSGKTQAIELEISSSKRTLQKLKKLLDMTDRVLIVCDKLVLVNEFKEKIEKMNIDQDRVRVRKIQDIEF